jgi:mannose-6-phosphate isomerase-like protein (cupin superfamily)
MLIYARRFIAIVAAVVVAFLAGLVLPAAADGVIFIPADQVNAAFAKGAVLINNSNYMVHASRRDVAGQVEVHEKDADIIYVLDGTTTFVTGGTLVGGRPTDPGEIRGTNIRGGDVRQLKKGDVIVVPKGTPHWFKELSAPFLYYVVKVR